LKDDISDHYHFYDNRKATGRSTSYEGTLIGLLKKNYYALQKESHDEWNWGPDNDGITKEDLEKYRLNYPGLGKLESLFSRQSP